MGLEATPEAYTEGMADLFGAVMRALKPDGTLWLNLGDSYATGAGKVGECPGGGEQGKRWAGSKNASAMNNMGPITQPNRMPQKNLKPKDLVGIPWRVAFALQAAGWYLRSDIIWHKPNPMPESVTDRPTKAHEYIFLMSKSEKYYYNHEAVKEPVAESTIARKAVDFGGQKGRRYEPKKGDPNYRGGHEQWGRTFDYQKSCKNGRNKRTVWEVPTRPYPGAHFAVFPPELIEPCILAGTKEGDVVLDPFNGSGTVAHVCKKHKRQYVGIELNAEYLKLNPDRIGAQGQLI
jgi:DNA modification methylase